VTAGSGAGALVAILLMLWLALRLARSGPAGRPAGPGGAAPAAAGPEHPTDRDLVDVRDLLDFEELVDVRRRTVRARSHGSDDDAG
jgi:hypothetical protein